MFLYCGRFQCDSCIISPPHPMQEVSSYKDPTKPKEDPPKPTPDLPHPLADSAIDEGVTVVLDETGSSSPRLFQRSSNSPAPPPDQGVKAHSLPKSGPPVPTPRTSSSNNLTPPESPPFSHKTPPSPAPRSRHGGGSASLGSVSAPGSIRRTFSGEAPTENRVSENGRSEGGADPPTPSVRYVQATPFYRWGKGGTDPTCRVCKATPFYRWAKEGRHGHLPAIGHTPLWRNFYRS